MKRRSLRRETEAARRELAKETGVRRRAGLMLRLAFERTRESEWLFLGVVVVVGVAGLWAPRLVAGQWPASQTVTRILPVAWQVQGAALGLSLVVVVFSFQAFSESRYAGSLREFAAYSLATPIVLFGLVSLLVDGLALLGMGRGGSNGWAGVWALHLSVISIALLPILLILLLRGLEPRSLHLWRITRLRRFMRLEVAEDLKGRLAFSGLSRACEEIGWEFLPLFGAIDRAQWQEIRPSSDGVVADVNLHVLKQVVDLCPPGARPVLLVRYEQRVTESQPVVLVPDSGDAALKPTAQGLLKIASRREPDESPLEASVKQLHQQALRAFNDRNAVWYDEIADAYEETLLALPQAWADYGVRTFHQGLMQPFDFVSRAPIELIIRQLYREMQSAFRSSEPEIVERAVQLPYSTLLRSWEVGAEALSKVMLDLLVQAYQLAAAAPDATLAEVGIDRITRYLLEFAQWSSYRARDTKERDESG